MNTHEFVEFCEAIEHGRERLVRYVGHHEGLSVQEKVGRVLSCDGRRFEVETADGRHSWPMERCETVSEGSGMDVSGGE